MATHDDPPLVLLVCIDALRYDCLNWQPDRPYFRKFDYPPNLRTPTLDRIGAESVRFHKAVSHAGYTPLSLATTLTGAYARTHGVVDFQNTTCRPDVQPLATLFRRAGWRTLGAAGPEFLRSIGLARDLDALYASEGPLLEALEARPDTPTFAFVHFNDVHHPYVFQYWDDPRCDNRDFELMMQMEFGLWVDEPRREFVDAKGARAGFDKWSQIIAAPVPPEHVGTRARNLFRYYLHGLQKFDQVRLAGFVQRLEQAGLWQRAVVVFFADHGEILWPQLPWTLGHGKLVSEQLMRVPLMIRAPGHAPRDVHALVGLVDLYDTLLDLSGLRARGVEPDHATDGRSLLPAIERDAPVQCEYFHEGYSVLVAEQKHLPVLYQRALRTQDDEKYLVTGDLMDPREFNALDDEAFVQYVIERALGEIAYPATRDAVRAHLARGLLRLDIAAGLPNNVPRYRYFNLADDPFEEHGESLHPQHPRWPTYLQYLARMQALKGRPNLIAPDAAISPEEERKLMQHLGNLGYVEV